MRSLTNERNDFLMATFPIADMMLAAPSPIVFPQIADGGGYVTQFILIGAGGASSVTLNFYGQDGKPLPVGKRLDMTGKGFWVLPTLSAILLLVLGAWLAHRLTIRRDRRTLRLWFR
jgi:hypothetical protein